MSNLYVLRKGRLARASRSDVLEWLGWKKCEECEGRGQFKHLDGIRACPNCLDGLVPPAHQVEALAESLWRQFLAIFDQEISEHSMWEENAEVHQKWRLRARTALIAEMRAVSDD